MANEEETADRLSILIAERLHDLSARPSDHTIYKVPRHLREVNEKAYEPQIVAIGPYHRDKEQLQSMERHKRLYVNMLLQRRRGEDVRRYVEAMWDLEKRARKCYAAESVTLGKYEFVEMMLLDGCFILELLRKCLQLGNTSSTNDPVSETAWIRKAVYRDLLLVENQIPFFVLEKLFDMTMMENEELSDIIYHFFHRELPKGNGPEQRTIDGEESTGNVKHLLGLLHADWLPSSIKIERDSWEMISCATDLKEAGIRFKKIKGNTSLFNVKFEGGVLKIPRLEVDDATETLFRNLIAYEQLFLDKSKNYVTDYMIFMDCLINTSEDVELLCQRGIIHNLLGNEEAVAQMFNRLGGNVIYTHSNFCYTEMFNKVNKHCTKRWNKWKANLRHKYFNTPWAFISFLAALLLVMLTVSQALFAVLDHIKRSEGRSRHN